MEPPRVLLSDAGRVLVHTDARKVCVEIGRIFGCPGDLTFEILLRSPHYAALERGDLDWEDYYLYCTETLEGVGTIRPSGWDRARFEWFWARILGEPIQEVQAIWSMLRQYLVIALASNVNELHYQQMVHGRGHVLRHVEIDHTPSFLLRVRKGDRHYFSTLLDVLGVRPEECMYVDDRPEFVGAAIAQGIRSVCLFAPDDEQVRLMRWEMEEKGIPRDWFLPREVRIRTEAGEV